MRGNDILLVPRCDAAEVATYCWHDVIKNTIQSFNDAYLQEWLNDTNAVRQFEAALKELLTAIDAFSPRVAAAKLAPINRMAKGERARLLTNLEALFCRHFDREGTQVGLRAVIEPLKKALRQCANSSRSASPEQLSMLRKLAADARTKIESLPAGFVIYWTENDD
jgi:hypothetical protein